MAYTEPTNKARGDDPSAAILQVYADNCDALAALAIGIANMADHGEDISATSDEYYTFPHRGTWLLYQTEAPDGDNKKTAELFPYYYRSEEDEEGLAHSIGEPTTLPDAPDGDAYNLDEGVNWMIPGRLYQIDNVRYAFEISDFSPD
jgi:hypothetical protein